MAETRAPVVKVTNKLRGYWPLTLRQIYYQLEDSTDQDFRVVQIGRYFLHP
jgi:hypothetical protein